MFQAKHHSAADGDEGLNLFCLNDSELKKRLYSI